MTTRRMSWLMTACAIGAAALPAAAQSGQLPLDALAKKASASLARLEFTVSNPLVTVPSRSGQCICIDEKRGTFITGDLPTGTPVNELKNLRLRQADNAGPWFDASLITIDPEEKWAFLKLELKEGQKNPWKQLSIASSKGLKIGQRVVSVGLLPDGVGNAPYLGTALVSALLRLPDQMVAVTGGDLTVSSSPVLTTDGLMVGIVGGQLPMQAKILLGGRQMDTALSLLDRTHYFIPSDEFAHILGNIAPGRKLPWMGTVTLEYLPENVAEDLPGLNGRPAIRIGRILPNSPATAAGLEQADVVVGLNGKGLKPMPNTRMVGREFVRQLDRFKPGQKITLTVLKDGKDVERTLTLAPKPAGPNEMPRYYCKELGFFGRDLTRFEIETQPGTPNVGVAVMGVMSKSPAAAGQLATNDLITHVNTRPVRNVTELAAILDPLKTGTKTITFNVIRRGVEQTVIVAPPAPKP